MQKDRILPVGEEVTTRQAPSPAIRSRTSHYQLCLGNQNACGHIVHVARNFRNLPVGEEATMRQAPPPAILSRTSHCATAARRSSGPARAAMPAAAALWTSSKTERCDELHAATFEKFTSSNPFCSIAPAPCQGNAAKHTRAAVKHTQAISSVPEIGGNGGLVSLRMCRQRRQHRQVHVRPVSTRAALVA